MLRASSSSTLRALSLGAVLGLGLSFIVLPSGCGPAQQRARCNRSNCNGCCDDLQQCQTGTAATACGEGAVTCQVCSAGQVCQAGNCRIGSGAGGGGGMNTDAGNQPCGPNTCQGCCNNQGQCVAGNAATACGKMGIVCNACGGSQTCVDGACSSQQCNGCRDAVSGTCLTGTDVSACGSAGGVCAACNVGQTCVNGSCQDMGCNSQNCSTGCCAGSTCIAMPTNAQCGSGGAQCVSCQGGATCTNGTCAGGNSGTDGGIFPDLDGGFGACGPQTCQTCCVAGLICAPTTNFLFCGSGGGTCVDCTAQAKFTCNMGVCQ